MTEHKHLKRLSRVWIPNAVYFITACTYNRQRILASQNTAEIIRRELSSAKDLHGWLVGRYMIMPDHVHFFCAESSPGTGHSLSVFMRGWKEWTSKAICQSGSVSSPVWQKEYFDHVMRSGESYREKWIYVRDNPLRAGLVKRGEEWPYQGCVNFDAPSGLRE